MSTEAQKYREKRKMDRIRQDTNQGKSKIDDEPERCGNNRTKPARSTESYATTVFENL